LDTGIGRLPTVRNDSRKDLLAISHAGLNAGGHRALGLQILLVYHPNPANLPLRKWLTYSVLPRLRDTPTANRHNAPTPGVLEWQTGELNVVHWQDEPWIRLRDMPCLLPRRDEVGAVRLGGWLKRFKQRFWGAMQL
jgi:prophage antirepressor-like protein